MIKKQNTFIISINQEKTFDKSIDTPPIQNNDMLKSIGFRDLLGLLQVRDDLIGSTLVDLCKIWLGDCLRCKLRDDQ